MITGKEKPTPSPEFFHYQVMCISPGSDLLLPDPAQRISCSLSRHTSSEALDTIRLPDLPQVSSKPNPHKPGYLLSCYSRRLPLSKVAAESVRCGPCRLDKSSKESSSPILPASIPTALASNTLERRALSLNTHPSTLQQSVFAQCPAVEQHGRPLMTLTQHLRGKYTGIDLRRFEAITNLNVGISS